MEVRLPIVRQIWITTTNDLVGRVLKDNETLTMRKDGRVAGVRWRMRGLIRTLAVSMLTMDEPDHTRLRSIVEEAFRRRAILDMEPRNGLIAELVRVIFRSSSVARRASRALEHTVARSGSRPRRPGKAGGSAAAQWRGRRRR